MINQGKNSLIFFSLVFIVSLAYVLGIDSRSNLVPLFGGYLVLFLSYLAIASNKTLTPNATRILFVITGLTPLFYQPHLSEDFARFIWDGQIFWQGTSPYANLPIELTSAHWYVSNPDLHEIFSNITHLSQKHYTCYPPINQLFFKIATLFTNNLYWSTFILKLEILTILGLGLHFFEKLVDYTNLNRSATAFLFLNPLLIIESLGNVHFEGVMLSLLIIALYLLLKNKFVYSAILFGLAIQIKLIPLILLPFLLPLLKWKKAGLYYGVVGITFTLPFLIEFNDIYLINFFISLELYFNSFEFNSVIYHYVIQLRKSADWPNQLLFYSRILSGFTFIIILGLAWIKSQQNFKGIINRMMMAYLVYLLLTSTIHPWYIIPLLGLSLLADNKFVILWSFVIFSTYFIYTTGDRSIRQLIINLEYIIVVAYFLWETYKNRRAINPSFVREQDRVRNLPKDDND